MFLWLYFNKSSLKLKLEWNRKCYKILEISLGSSSPCLSLTAAGTHHSMHWVFTIIKKMAFFIHCISMNRFWRSLLLRFQDERTHAKRVVFHCVLLQVCNYSAFRIKQKSTPSVWDWLTMRISLSHQTVCKDNAASPSIWISSSTHKQKQPITCCISFLLIKIQK